MRWWTDVKRILRRNFHGGDRGFPYWTTAVIVACLGMFALELKLSGDAAPKGPMPNPFVLERLGDLSGPRIHYDHQYWRFVTPILLHGGIAHIIMNSLGLWQLGRIVEEKFGVARAIYTFVIAGICGNLLSYAISGDMALSLGASGAIFGYIGLPLGFALRRREKSVRDQFVPMAIYGLIMSFLPMIDWRAHLGGGLAGLLLGAFLADKRMARRLPEAVSIALAVMALAVVGWALISAAQHPLSIPPMPDDLG